jgi:hypothetical protein
MSIALAMFANYGVFLFLTYILQGTEHLSPLAAGLGFLPLTVINGLASTQVASRFMVRVPVRAIVIPGLLTGAAGVALFALPAVAADPQQGAKAGLWGPGERVDLDDSADLPHARRRGYGGGLARDRVSDNDRGPPR